MNTPPIPATIVTGFLGSGKTTLINHWLDWLGQRGEKVAYVKNEIGATDIDTTLLRGKNIASAELLNGCICCTLVGPFVDSIDELIKTHQPDRVIIESAGTAEPTALALMVDNHPQLDRDGMVSIIDVLNFEGYNEVTEAAKRQAELTDLLILNKVEQADLLTKKRVVGYLREVNETAPIVEAPNGKLNPDLVFGLQSVAVPTHHQHQDHDQHDHTDDDHHHGHEHTDGIDAITLSLAPVDLAVLTQVVEQLPRKVIRVKGWVNTSQGWQVLNAVNRRVGWSQLEKTPDNSQLILIGFGMASLQAELEGLLRQAELRPGGTS